MQAVFNNSMDFTGARLLNFAGGRDYMMRSEKRSRSGGSPSGAPKKRPPKKRRRRRAGFFYKLIMMLLLLVLWPFGLLMLWQRKVRWGAGTKLLTSVVTLGASIVLIGFALTVNTGNADYTAMQDKANNYLDIAADALIEASDVVIEKSAVISDNAANLADAAWNHVREDAFDSVAYLADLGSQTRAKIVELVDSIGVENPDAEVTPVPTDESTPDATVKAEATPVPSPEVTVNAESSELPVYVPEVSPSAAAGLSIESGILTREGELSEVTLPPIITPEPTPEPTPENLTFAVKDAAQAVVYFNDGGKCYHMAPQCGTMLSAAEHTLGDTLNSAVRRCTLCSTPDKTILDEKYIIWTDGDKLAHLSDECKAFTGGWNIISAAQANTDGLKGCEICEADRYLKAVAAGKPVTLAAPVTKATAVPTAEATTAPTAEPTLEPTKAPTAEPTAAPTSEPVPAPTEIVIVAAAALPLEAENEAAAAVAPEVTAEPEVEIRFIADAAGAGEAASPAPTAAAKPTARLMTITPTRALKEAALANVHLEGNTIHLLPDCAAISGEAAACTLTDCSGALPCEACGAPPAEYALEHCLWQDEDGLCHTGDECEAFVGQFRLILRDEALAQGFAGCKQCKASEYLFPNTAINYDGVRKQ